MKQKTIEAIELFIEKTEKLKSFDFVVSPKRIKFKWSWNQGNEKVEISGPREQDIDAFLLTYRLFFDKKEHCSFRWLANNILGDPDLSESWKKGFSEQRNSLNHFLNSYPSIRVTNNHYPTPMTNKDIKDLFLFADRSHVTWDLEKRKKFNNLMLHSASMSLLTSQFVDILFITFDMITKVSDLCKTELEKNKSTR